jgi:hypothetical protein
LEEFHEWVNDTYSKKKIEVLPEYKKQLEKKTKIFIDLEKTRIKYEEPFEIFKFSNKIDKVNYFL